MDKVIFKAGRHYVACNQTLNFPAVKVFPLLCPTREFEWIETWRGNVLYSDSGFAEPDCIFTTRLSDGRTETWFIDVFEENEKIQFIRFNSSNIIRYRITLKDNINGTSSAIWEQTITALNEEGNRYIENFSDAGFAEHIGELEKMLNYYLETGSMLRVNK